jgi:membrane protease YdiL (CAAX protease family)
LTGIPAPTAAFLLLSSSRSKAWADVAVLIVCLVLVEFLGAAFLSLALDVPIVPQPGVTDSAEWELTRVMLAPTLSIRAVGSILIIAAILACRQQSIRSVGLRSTGLLPNIALGVAAMMVAYVLIALTIPVLSLIWPSTRDQMVENAELILKMVPRLDLLGFGGLAVAIGVYEEIVFRGFLMTRLRRATGNWIFAVLLSTAVFTCLHALDQTATALVAVTILSLVFSGVTIWRRSIVPAIVGHALFDWSQFFFLWYQTGDSWL